MTATVLAQAHRGCPQPFPLYLSRVECGFPSPADDFVEGVLDLNDLCIDDEAATFFVRANGDSMTGVGIHDGDVLVVSRAAEPADGDVVIAALGGDMTVKELRREGGAWWLMPANPEHAPIKVDMDLEIWGVVTHALHFVRG